MHDTMIIKSGEHFTIEKYIIGQTYEGKGKYLGRTKGAHKFEKHQHGHYRKEFGNKYHFEKF